MKSATCRLYADVSYDPEVTDPDAVSTAVDRMIETALETPNLLDEVGNPEIGPLFVDELKTVKLEDYGQRIAAMSREEVGCLAVGLISALTQSGPDATLKALRNWGLVAEEGE